MKVYLDTSDFSVLSPKGSSLLEADRIEILDDLIRLKSTHNVTYIYSFAHIFEILKEYEKSQFSAKQKADTIELLCGNTCCRYILDIIEDEIFFSLTRTNCSPDYAYSQYSMWHPKIEFGKYEIRKVLKKAIKDLIKEDIPLNRSARLRFRKEMRKVDFKAMLLARSDSEKHHFMSQLSQDFPIPIGRERFNELVDLLFGDHDPEKARSVMEDIFRPSSYVSWACERYDSAKTFPEILTGLADNIISAAETFRSEARRLNLRRDNRLSLQDTLFYGVTERIMITSKREFGKRGLRLRRRSSTRPKLPNDEIQTLDALCYATDRYLAQSFPQSKHERKLKHSDAGDLLHSAYVPHVDIFRTDKYFSTVVQGLADLYGTVVETKLERLPERIRALSTV